MLKWFFEGPEKSRESTSQQTNANKHRKELWLARGSIVSHSSNESMGRP